MSKHNHKPFEQHIESNAFNINPLVDAGTNVTHQVLHPRLEEWLDSLPHPLTIGQWDSELDDMQKRLRHSLAVEIIERGMLDEFAEQLEHIDQETLLLLMQYPLTLAMLSQDYFRQNGYPYGWELPDSSPEQSHETANPISKSQKIRQVVRQMIQYIKTQLNFRRSS